METRVINLEEDYNELRVITSDRGSKTTRHAKNYPVHNPAHNRTVYFSDSEQITQLDEPTSSVRHRRGHNEIYPIVDYDKQVRIWSRYGIVSGPETFTL